MFMNSFDRNNSSFCTRGFCAEGSRRAYNANNAHSASALILSLDTALAVSIFVALALIIVSLVSLLGLIVLASVVIVLISVISVIIIRFTAVLRPCLATAS